MAQNVKRSLPDEVDVEAAIGDDEPAVDETRALAAALEGERGPEDATDAMDAEDLEEQLEDGTPGLEEQILHLDEPVTDMLDDEADVAEDVLDEEQRADLEWRMDDANPPTTPPQRRPDRRSSRHS